MIAQNVIVISESFLTWHVQDSVILPSPWIYFSSTGICPYRVTFCSQLFNWLITFGFAAVLLSSVLHECFWLFILSLLLSCTVSTACFSDLTRLIPASPPCHILHGIVEFHRFVPRLDIDRINTNPWKTIHVMMVVVCDLKLHQISPACPYTWKCPQVISVSVACVANSNVLLLDQELLISYLYSSFCWGDHAHKSPRLCHFKSDQDDIWQGCFSCK